MRMQSSFWQHAVPSCRIHTRDALVPDELLKRCRDADALIAFMADRITEPFLARCARLRIIACALKGNDSFDVAARTRHGVWLTVVPDLLTALTAELTVGLIIALGRRMLPGDRLIRAGLFRGWRPTLYGRGLEGSTVGLVGAGAVGKAVAQRLVGFGPTVLYTDPRPVAFEEKRRLGLHRVQLGELLDRSDYVVLCLPLIGETRHLVGRTFLSRMKWGAYLVNTARGSLVDEGAVAEALESQALAGYAADVFALGDLALADRPREINLRLRNAKENTMFTPHLGSAVDEVRRDVALAAANSVLECLRGRTPPGAVNRPRVRRGAPSQ